jgi:hypothetical protein
LLTEVTIRILALPALEVSSGMLNCTTYWLATASRIFFSRRPCLFFIPFLGMAACTTLDYAGSEVLQPEPLRSPLALQESQPPHADRLLVSKEGESLSPANQCRATRICAGFLSGNLKGGAVWLVTPASCMLRGANGVQVSQQLRCPVSRFFLHPKYSKRRQGSSFYDLAILRSDCPAALADEEWPCARLLTSAPARGIESFVMRPESTTVVSAQNKEKLAGSLLHGYQSMRLIQDDHATCRLAAGVPVYSRPTAHFYLTGITQERQCVKGIKEFDISLIPSNGDWIQQTIIQDSFARPGPR